MLFCEIPIVPCYEQRYYLRYVGLHEGKDLRFEIQLFTVQYRLFMHMNVVELFLTVSYCSLCTNHSVESNWRWRAMCAWGWGRQSMLEGGGGPPCQLTRATCLCSVDANGIGWVVSRAFVRSCLILREELMLWNCLRWCVCHSLFILNGPCRMSLCYMGGISVYRAPVAWCSSCRAQRPPWKGFILFWSRCKMFLALRYIITLRRFLACVFTFRCVALCGIEAGSGSCLVPNGGAASSLCRETTSSSLVGVRVVKSAIFMALSRHRLPPPRLLVHILVWWTCLENHKTLKI